MVPRKRIWEYLEKGEKEISKVIERIAGLVVEGLGAKVALSVRGLILVSVSMEGMVVAGIVAVGREQGNQCSWGLSQQSRLEGMELMAAAG